MGGINVDGIWNWDFMWNTFAFILKLAAPFVMIIIGIIGVGMLLKMVVGAVVTAVKNR